MLDQLAGDVHTLERKAAAVTAVAAHFRPSPRHPQEEAPGDDSKPDGQDEVPVLLRDSRVKDVPPEAQQQDGDTAVELVRERSRRDDHGRCHDEPSTGCEKNVHAARERSSRGDEPSEHDDILGKSRFDSNNQEDTAKNQPVGRGSSGTPTSSAPANYQHGGAAARGEPGKSLHEGAEVPLVASLNESRPPNQASLGLPPQSSPTVVEKEEEPAENAQLRFDLREARKLAEAYRRKFAAALKT